MTRTQQAAPDRPGRIRIAIQKSGRLANESQALLRQCGLRFNGHDQRLMTHVENLPVDILHVRDDDIPGLVMDGVVDLGFVGENVLEEERLERQALGRDADFHRLRKLDFGSCRLAIAVPEDRDYTGPGSLADCRIATSYPNLLRRYFDEQGIRFKSCLLKGAVEVAPRAGLADAICDLVSTGATLDANGLRDVEVIFRSTATLIRSTRTLGDSCQALVDKLLVRIGGIIQARESKYIMLHAPRAALEQIITLLPGAENPTLIPLAEDDSRVALHAVSAESLFWDTMEELKALGASSILVLPIEKMLG